MFLAPTEALAADRVELDGPEGHHAADVRRLRVGEAVWVADGRGLVVRGVVVAVARGRLTVEVHEREQAPAASPRFVVVQATAKGGRDVDAVESMTEVGADEFVGWQAERSVARWSDRAEARWEAAAREAAKQARRAWVPDVTGPASTADVEERIRAAALAVVLHEAATTPLTTVAVPSSGEVVVVVGPEGGLTDAEVDELTAAGGVACRIGSNVLRTSTAGVVALAVLGAGVDRFIGS
ncbi:MAG: 16S rRNA (uracil(1498)-N(3))-methyltransferase [Frankiales bacterium]|nr:16S rRNA (uracil(1498)-N(3))-methyltransferase [Frankiales bacterium]